MLLQLNLQAIAVAVNYVKQSIMFLQTSIKQSSTKSVTPVPLNFGFQRNSLKFKLIAAIRSQT